CARYDGNLYYYAMDYW
nr:immunoglobulin heavy chain junction region [Mus musculus]NSM04548.1 immunoglobulin heavy chain junction region [Mus musculus]NSM06378.1 immunoglobulin heavy chain junction region [Mus musculus]NSM07179.1 immunoglobulin heavy chain junction region [Mus musculus]NSM07544.1 immunoglobulin heavy chain junction region [Mus musculus]